MNTGLSVIMPSLNVADYIEECINSALNQTLNEMEIICIDAGSEDGTWEILKRYENTGDSGKRVRLIRSDVKSYGYQVNLGIELAVGKYVAVLETDDMADERMYEHLVGLAERYALDFVKADYDCFYTLKKGERYYERVSLLRGARDRYNSVSDPSDDDYLYAHDCSIWAGIFNRNFLRRNNIRLNETEGAAYQDIGFALQVLACAKRAYYSDHSFYRYRRDRETSSANSPYGLRYSRREFERLLSDDGIRDRLKCRQGFYWRMAGSFAAEYWKASAGCSTEPLQIQSDYEWFRRILTEAVERAEFDMDRLPDGFRKELLFILEDGGRYAEEVRMREEERRRAADRLLRTVGGNDAAVFGAGRRGKAAVVSLLQIGIKPIRVYDNNEGIWGEHIYGVTIGRPEKPADNVTVFIANKLNGREIMKQMTDMGIPREQIAWWEG
ncbi:MAG: glycosyltransferase [Lachnospiraceae bacterium]|nr:glycosyltransferase [Lachnospiraceae bacterium]